MIPNGKPIAFVILGVLAFVQIIKTVTSQMGYDIKGRWAVLLNFVSSIAAGLIAANVSDVNGLYAALAASLGAGGVFSLGKSLAQAQPPQSSSGNLAAPPPGRS